MYPFFDLDPAPWSNNFDDEEIDESFLKLEPLEAIKFTLIDNFKEKFGKEKIDAERLFVSLKSAASCFFHAQFPNKYHIGDIVIPEIEKGVSSSPINQKTCKIYSLDENELKNVLVIVQFEIPTERAFGFTKTLFENISSENVYVFDTIFPVNITSSEIVTIPSIYMLETEKSKKSNDHKTICKYLAAPSLIEKGTAAILSHRQVRGLKAEAYLSVEDPSLLEISSLIAFEDALKSILNKEVALKIKEYSNTLETLNSRRPNPLFT